MTTSEIIIALYQNTKTAMQSIADIKPKTDNKEFLTILETQENRYKNMNEKIEKVAREKLGMYKTNERVYVNIGN